MSDLKLTIRGPVEWAINNPVLAINEFGVEALIIGADGELTFAVDENGRAVAKCKIGDGQTDWNSLPYTPELMFVSATEEWKAALEEAREAAAKAQAASEEAKAQAEEAKHQANNVGNAAQNAINIASEAQTQAGQAAGAASEAKETASQALANSAQASTDAAAALDVSEASRTLAAEARDLAIQANGIFKTCDQFIDANEIFIDPARYYVVGADTKNFPLQSPFFFENIIDDRQSVACQQVWDSNGLTLHRVGLITSQPGEPEEAAPVFTVAWGVWVVVGGGFPKGGIIMWSGAIANIPDGWALCNGQNGTPNLLDRFVVGAGYSYGVGAAGGATSHGGHSITGYADNHTLVEGQMPHHRHYVMEYAGASGEHYTHLNAQSVNNYSGSYSGYTGGNGAHYHNWIHTGTGAVNHLPPYYALAYIMKL